MSGLPFKLGAGAATAARKVLAELRRGKRFLAASHIRADGDGLGSALAFVRLARKLGKKAHAAAELGAIPEYRFLPGADAVADGPAGLWPAYDAVFTFDCGSFDRLGTIGAALPRESRVVNVDHHVSNTRFGAVNWVDDSFASTTEMAYVLAKFSGTKIDADMATNLYTGIVTDTGGFSFSNTSARTHAIAADLLACGVKPAKVTGELYRQKTPGQLKLLARMAESIRATDDGTVAWAVLTRAMTDECGHYPYETQEYVNLIRSMKGVRVAILFRELKEDPRIRISFRTSDGVDGSKLASFFGGGGHRRASGAMLEGGAEEVAARVVRRAVEFVSEAGRA